MKSIKKTLSFMTMTILCTLLAMSCGNDDDGSGDFSIVGTWVVHSEGCFCASGAVDEYFPPDECTAMSRFVFGADQTVFFVEHYLEGDDECMSEMSNTGTYTLVDNVLTISADGDLEINRVIEVTNDRIQLVYDIEDDEYMCDDGSYVTEEFIALDRRP